MKKLFLFIAVFLLMINGFSQNPQRELRGTWLATVSNIDWPKSMDMATQKQELITILEKLEAMNMNAVFLQVRPYSDAFYNSDYEPWSSYITGTRSKNPGYDPLQFAIDEAHKRGIEIHAWMNPYRASSNSVNDCVGTQASWFMNVENKTYYNPGLPEVTTYITNVISDMVGKYNLDGVIFDDYFYPDNMNENNTVDANAFATYGGGETLGNFRRESVNSMISAVNTAIKALKPDLRFGVGPFGVYINNTIPNNIGIPVPSGITGWDVYNRIYCDPLAWFEEGSIDYISPQLYWPIDRVGQEYGVLTEWWGKVAKHYGKHCYPGLGAHNVPDESKTEASEIKRIELYKISQKSLPKDYSYQEIIDEININRANEINNVFGSVFYSTKHITGDTPGLGEYIYENAFQEQAIYQELSWLTSTATTIPTNLVISQGETVSQLTWTGNDPKYAIFGVNPETKAEPTFLKMVFAESFSLQNMNEFTEFAVAGINGKGEISSLSSNVQLAAPTAPTLTSPIDKEISSTETFTWNAASNATSYTINIFSDEALTTKVYTENLVTNTFVFNEIILDGQETYYWNIVAINGVATNTSVSAIFTTGFPSQTQISNIENNQTQVAINGTIQCTSIAEASSYYFQLARDASFYITQIVLDEEVTSNSLPYTSLIENEEYFVRVYAKNDKGNGKWSETVKFTSYVTLPDAPTITAPTEAEFIDETTVKIEWSKITGADTYKINIANTDDFATVIHTQEFNSYTRTLDYTIEYGKKYYVRVAAKKNEIWSNWSETRYFTNKTPNGIESALLNNMKIFPNPVENNLNIELSDNQFIKNIRIYSITGSLLLEQNFQNNKINLNLSDFPSGIYQGIIRTSEKKDFSFRFIKK